MATSNNDTSTQHFKYPPVQVSRSVSTLDLDTLIMRSTSRRHPAEAGSALDESTFEFLGDSLLETSDDEAHTESIASTTTDDASDFSDDDVEYPNDGPELQHSMHPSLTSDLEQQHDSRMGHSPGDSTLTEVPAYAFYHGEPRTIRLDERPGQEPGILQGSTVYRSFPEEDGDFPAILKNYGCDQVRFVFRAALSERSIPTPDSYKILYVGQISATDEELVSSQICAALTASQSTTRSVMVQGRLQPYSPVMHSWHCAAEDIQTVSPKDEPSRIVMTLKEGMRLTLGPARQYPSEEQPDLVIFCNPPAPRHAGEPKAYDSAREVCARENIPRMDMISVKQYGSGDASYAPETLCVCIEGRNNSRDDYELLEVHPMDYWTFGSLEPAQINRHLALLSPHMFASTDKRPRASKIGDLWRSYTKQLTAPQVTPMRTVVMLMLFTAMVTGFFYGPIMGTMMRGMQTGHTVLGSEVTDAMVPASYELISSSASNALTTPATSISQLAPPAVTSASSGLSLVPQQPKAKKLEKKKDVKTVPFTIETTSDQQFALVPHKDILNARKKPQLQIKVTRDSQVVPVRFNRTISGTYIVDFEHQEPFGTFNVSIASYSKPLLQQSFEIALGQNKSGLAQYLDMAKKTLVETQQRLNTTAFEWSDMISGTGVNAAAQYCKQSVRVLREDFVSGVRTIKDTAGRVLTVSPS